MPMKEQELRGRVFSGEKLTRRLFTQTLLGGAVLALPPAVLEAAYAGAEKVLHGLLPGQDNGASQVFPTGRQYQVEGYNQRLVVTEVGATLRSYQVDGQEFLWGFRETELPNSSSGQLLFPWAGRCEAGAYTFQGVVQQLAINNVAANTAQHGLVRLMDWNVSQHDQRQITMELVLHPQAGYPFTLSLRQQYELTNGGLIVTTSATNVGATPAPYAVGMHPYFTVGTLKIDNNILKVPARRYLPRTANGAAIIPMEPVNATLWDFRSAAPIGNSLFATAIAYGDLIRDADGRARTVLSNPSGSPTVTVWTDEATDFLTLFTTPNRPSLAIEPCTAPSNAFNHGLGLRTLAAGETFRSSFGVQVATS
jgi:aldose 1-epimerase